MSKKIIKYTLGILCAVTLVGVQAPSCDAAKTVKTVTKKVSKGKIQTKNGSLSVSKKTKKVSLKKSGTYTISGKISGYSFVVTKKNAKVIVILNGATVSNSKTSCFYNKNSKATLTLQGKKGKTNTISGPKSYPVAKNKKEPDVDAAVYSEGNITFSGSGTISVTDSSSNGEAIHSKASLTVKSGTVKAVSKKTAFHGKNVYVKGGTLNVNGADTGIKSKQNVYIQGGSATVVAGDKGIHGKTGISITGGTIGVTVQKATGTTFEDFRGIVAGSTGKNISGSIQISAGTITVNSFGDCIRASKDVTITGGTFKLTSTDDDGIQAKGTLTISGNPSFTIQAKGKKTKGETKNIASTINI
jgi:hypothetical protein